MSDVLKSSPIKFGVYFSDIYDFEKLTIYDQTVYILICKFMNNEDNTAFPSIKKLARMGRMSERSVQKALNNLVDNFLIDKEVRFEPMKKDPSKQRQTSNLYTVRIPSDAMRILKTKGVHDVHGGSSAPNAGEGVHDVLGAGAPDADHELYHLNYTKKDLDDDDILIDLKNENEKRKQEVKNARRLMQEEKARNFVMDLVFEDGNEQHLLLYQWLLQKQKNMSVLDVAEFFYYLTTNTEWHEYNEKDILAAVARLPYAESNPNTFLARALEKIQKKRLGIKEYQYAAGLDGPSVANKVPFYDWINERD